MLLAWTDTGRTDGRRHKAAGDCLGAQGALKEMGKLAILQLCALLRSGDLEQC